MSARLKTKVGKRVDGMLKKRKDNMAYGEAHCVQVTAIKVGTACAALAYHHHHHPAWPLATQGTAGGLPGHPQPKAVHGHTKQVIAENEKFKLQYRRTKEGCCMITTACLDASCPLRLRASWLQAGCERLHGGALVGMSPASCSVQIIQG
jgi:hypothetical protein